MSRFVDIDEKRSLYLTWDLELDINDASVELELPAETRFGGDCVLFAKVSAPRTDSLVLKWKGLQIGDIGSQFDCTAVFSWLDADGTASVIRSVNWRGMGIFPGIDDDDFSCTIKPDDFSGARTSFKASIIRRFRMRFALEGMTAPASVVKAVPLQSIAPAVSRESFGRALSTAEVADHGFRTSASRFLLALPQ
jgi:hypothetical protein